MTKSFLCLTTIPTRFNNLTTIIEMMNSNQDNDFNEIRIYIPHNYHRFGDSFNVPYHLNEYENVKICRCAPDFGPASKFIFPVIYDDEIKDDDKIFILDDDNYKKNGWFKTLNNELENNNDSIVQLNYGKHYIPQIHGVSVIFFYKKILNNNHFKNFFTKLPIRLLFIDDDMLSYYLYRQNIKIHITKKTIGRIYLDLSNSLFNAGGILKRNNLRKLAIKYIKNYKNKTNYPFHLLI